MKASVRWLQSSVLQSNGGVANNRMMSTNEGRGRMQGMDSVFLGLTGTWAKLPAPGDMGVHLDLTLVFQKTPILFLLATGECFENGTHQC